MNLTPTIRIKTVDLQEAALIILIVRAEIVTSGRCLTKDALWPFGWEEFEFKLSEEHEDKSAAELIVSKLPAKSTKDNEPGPFESKPNRKQEGEDQEDRQAEEPMDQDPTKRKKMIKLGHH